MSDIKNFLDIVEEYSEEDTLVEAQDSFDIELGEDLLIETGVIDITEDGILVEGDEETLRLLAEHGLILEETDWSKYDEPTVARIKKGVTKPVDRTDYDVPPAMRDKDQGKPGYEKRRSLIMKGLKAVTEAEHDYGNLTVKDIHSLADKAGLTNGIRPYHAKLAELVIRYCKKQNTDVLSTRVIMELGYRAGISEMEPWDIKFAKLVANACMKGMPKDPLGLDEKMVMGIPGDQGSKVMGEMSMDKVTINGKSVNIRSIEVDGVDTRDYPDFSDSYATYAEFEDGTPLSDQELELLKDKHGDVVYQVVYDTLFEAEYQGRKVPLGKPMKGDVKKSKVYVRKPNGKVVKVNFGDKNMKIKKSNPKRRKSFRARHNCKNPGPRWKARYWSCRAW